jgi:hypothetical protein
MKLIRVLLPILVIGLGFNCRAETNGAALDPAQELFFSQFRTAIHGEDTRQLMGLTHPLALQCTKVDGQEQHYGLIMKGLVQMLGHQQTIKEIRSKKVEVADIQKTSDTAAQSGMKWPLPPAEQLIVTYDKDGSESTATIYIARDQDQWKWVHLCYQ